MVTRYPNVLQKLLEAMEGFRARHVPLQELQNLLYHAANAITLPEESSLSEMLDSAGERLEMIRFTVEPEDVFAEAEAVVQTLEARIRNAIHS